MNLNPQCPACGQSLTMEEHPNPSKQNPKPYFMLFCENPRCLSDVARNDGGSAPTEAAAFNALCMAVDHEIESILPIEQQDRNAWAKADHANDIAKGGV